MRAKLASQSIIAAKAAAWPRTAVGNTSPCSVQPTPPTPTANEAMKKSRPIMMTTSRSVPDVKARPGRGDQREDDHPGVAADGE